MTRNDDGLLKELRAMVARPDGQDDTDWQKLERDVLKVIAKLRGKLTPQENSQWTNEKIVHTFLTLDNDAAYSDGAAAKQMLLQASAAELSQEPEAFQTVAQSARLYEALHKHAEMFWSKVLKCARLSMHRGKYMAEGGRDKGMIRYAGGEQQVAKIAAHSEENVYGVHQRGDFVPGSGGLQVWRGATHDGEGVEDGEPILTIGHGPESDGDPNSETAEQIAQRLREKWGRERDRKLNDAAD